MKVGEFYVIEIAEVFKGAESGETKCRIKGFDNLVFDKKGLAKLEKLDVDSLVKHIKEFENRAYKNGRATGIILGKQLNRHYEVAMDSEGEIYTDIEGDGIEC